MLVPTVLRGGEHEHLDLVELMHTDDPARVLARRPRLAAEAGGEGGVAQRQRPLLEDLAGVKRCERNLGCARQVEVLIADRIDLLLGVGQHAGAEERVVAHQHRRDHRLEAL